MCGIVGVYGNKNASYLASLGLFAEQHRGQNSCGISATNGTIFKIKKNLGLVKDVFTPKALEELPGNIAIGHVRYPTRGSATAFNSQPHIVETLSGPSYSLASNGDITNYFDMKRKLENKGVYFNSENDGELLLKYLIFKIENENHSVIEAIKSLMENIKGAYSTVFATKNELYMFRDPLGIRPMSWGKIENNGVAVASESCALDIMAAVDIQPVKPAQIIVTNDKNIRIIDNDIKGFEKFKNPAHCIFENIYFSRPDSINFGENIYEVRKKIGENLSIQDKNLNPDVVCPVPDSANFIAEGYAEALNIPYAMGLIRNHYVGRTFIKPKQSVRDESVSQKFNPLPGFFKDKKVVLIDDSIVRGTTIKKIIKIVKKAGAKEIHLRIGSPAVKYSCFYGIDTPTSEELIANRKSVTEIKNYLEVDSFRYISIDELENSVTKSDKFCYACFTGNYPLED